MSTVNRAVILLLLAVPLCSPFSAQVYLMLVYAAHKAVTGLVQRMMASSSPSEESHSRRRE